MEIGKIFSGFFFPHFREMPLTGLLMFPASIWLHSYPAPAVCFWLFLLADSRTWLSRMFWRLRNLRLLFSFTFSFVVFCLCPIPINFTRRASNVKPAINWPFMISSAKSWFPIFLRGGGGAFIKNQGFIWNGRLFWYSYQLDSKINTKTKFNC